MPMLRSAAWPDHVHAVDFDELGDEVNTPDACTTSSASHTSAVMETATSGWETSAECQTTASRVPDEDDDAVNDEPETSLTEVRPTDEKMETTETRGRSMTTSRSPTIASLEGVQPGERLPDMSGVFQGTFRAYAVQSREKLRQDREAMGIVNNPVPRKLPDTSAIFATTFRSFRHRGGLGQTPTR